MDKEKERRIYRKGRKKIRKGTTCKEWKGSHTGEGKKEKRKKILLKERTENNKDGEASQE